MEQDNRRRALHEIISLDVWHKGFTKIRDTSDLYVDVTFSEGRISGRPDEDVSFRLKLKKAEIVVIVPPTEPAIIDKSSVNRDSDRKKVIVEQADKTAGNINVGIDASLKLSSGIPKYDIGANSAASASKLREKTLKVLEEYSNIMKVVQSRTLEGDYVWHIEATTDEFLNGKPWDAVDKPRMQVIDTRPDRMKGIEPSIRVEARCRREDLEIFDIKVRSNNIWRRVVELNIEKNRVLAAEAAIRTRLFEAGLVFGNMRDPYSQMTICAIISEAS
jgi:hypothetical protein